MAAYDLLASHYDEVVPDPAAEAAFVRGIIERRCSGAVTLLDVACGTGRVTSQLAGVYRVTGLDISPAMLAIARQKLPPETPLHLADMTGFELGITFDVALCAYQSVNHLLDFSAWESFFDCVHRHLNEGGLFIFDIVTVGHLVMAAEIGRRVLKFDGNYVQITMRTIDEAISEWNIEVFELQPDGRHRKFTEILTMRSFPFDTVREALRRGFTDIDTIDTHGNTVGEENLNRTWFVCTKRGRPLGTRSASRVSGANQRGHHGGSLPVSLANRS
jgi:SAM-dependent methyltransferase